MRDHREEASTTEPFEADGAANCPCWKVELSAEDGGQALAFWTGRARDAATAEAVGRMVLNGTWWARTGEPGLPGEIARFAKASAYSANDFAKIASRSLSADFSDAAGEEGRMAPRIERKAIEAAMTATCASDGAIHALASQRQVLATMAWSNMNSGVQAKFAQVRVSPTDGSRIAVPIGRATSVALFLLGDLAAMSPHRGAEGHLLSEITYATPDHHGSKTMMAAYAANAARAVESATPAISLFDSIGRNDLSEAIRRQAQALEESMR